MHNIIFCMKIFKAYFCMIKFTEWQNIFRTFENMSHYIIIVLLFVLKPIWKTNHGCIIMVNPLLFSLHSAAEHFPLIALECTSLGREKKGPIKPKVSHDWRATRLKGRNLLSNRAAVSFPGKKFFTNPRKSNAKKPEEKETRTCNEYRKWRRYAGGLVLRRRHGIRAKTVIPLERGRDDLSHAVIARRRTLPFFFAHLQLNGAEFESF